MIVFSVVLFSANSICSCRADPVCCLLCNFRKLAHASAKCLPSITPKAKGCRTFVIDQVFGSPTAVMVLADAQWSPVSAASTTFLFFFIAMQFLVNICAGSWGRNMVLWLICVYYFFYVFKFPDYSRVLRHCSGSPSADSNAVSPGNKNATVPSMVICFRQNSLRHS